MPWCRRKAAVRRASSSSSSPPGTRTKPPLAPDGAPDERAVAGGDRVLQEEREGGLADAAGGDQAR